MLLKLLNIHDQIFTAGFTDRQSINQYIPSERVI